MAVDCFLELDKIEGESTITGFEKKIDILAWSWGMSQSGTRQMGTGGGSGKANISDINLTKYMDKSTPPMINNLCQGVHFEKAVLTVRKVSGGKPLDYLVLEMFEVMISTYQFGAAVGGDDRITESLSLNFARFTMTYLLQGVGGAQSAKVPVSYDIAKGPSA